MNVNVDKRLFYYTTVHIMIYGEGIDKEENRIIRLMMMMMNGCNI